jgi:hypothetical protein
MGKMDIEKLLMKSKEVIFMDFYLALLFLVILGGVTLYVLITRVIIPVYKLYQDRLQLK